MPTDRLAIQEARQIAGSIKPHVRSW